MVGYVEHGEWAGPRLVTRATPPRLVTATLCTGGGGHLWRPSCYSGRCVIITQCRPRPGPVTQILSIVTSAANRLINEVESAY